MTRLGGLIAVGRTSDVYAFGRGSVVKVPRDGMPQHWAALEAELTTSVHGRGLPTPEVRGLARIAGRDSVVFERINGPSMWEQMLDCPSRASDLAKHMAEIQLMVHEKDPPGSLPSLGDRVCSKLSAVERLTPGERQAGCHLVESLPPGSVLCHGDLHPGNVLMSDRGPIIIDWFDAALGSPAADIVRTSLLIRPLARSAGHSHLPGSTRALLSSIHRGYLARALGAREVDDVEPVTIRQWEAVLAASRVAEGSDQDESELLRLWRERQSGRSSSLSTALSDAGRWGDH